MPANSPVGRKSPRNSSMSQAIQKLQEIPRMFGKPLERVFTKIMRTLPPKGSIKLSAHIFRELNMQAQVLRMFDIIINVTEL